MGRSLPSFASTDCAITTYDPELATLGAVQLDQQETIRAGAKVFKDRSLGCWNRPEFKLTVKKQGVKKNVSFLGYLFFAMFETFCDLLTNGTIFEK